MKKLLLSLILLAALSAEAQPVPVGPRYIGVPSITPVTLSSNEIYNLIITYGGGVATNAIENSEGIGTNTTLLGSPLINQPTIFGGNWSATGRLSMNLTTAAESGFNDNLSTNPVLLIERSSTSAAEKYYYPLGLIIRNLRHDTNYYGDSAVMSFQSGPGYIDFTGNRYILFEKSSSTDNRGYSADALMGVSASGSLVLFDVTDNRHSFYALKDVFGGNVGIQSGNGVSGGGRVIINYLTEGGQTGTNGFAVHNGAGGEVAWLDGLGTLRLARNLVQTNAVASRVVMYDGLKYTTNVNLAPTAIVRANGTAVTIGTGLSDDGTTLTAIGGSGDTNAVSYQTLTNFIRTRTVSPSLDVGELRWTNGLPMLVATNYGSDIDTFHIKDSTGESRFRFTSGTGGDMVFNAAAGLDMHLNNVLVLHASIGERRLHATNGNTAFDFSDKSVPILGDYTIRLDLATDGEIFVVSGTQLVPTNSLPTLNITLINATNIATMITNAGMLGTDANSFLVEKFNAANLTNYTHGPVVIAGSGTTVTTNTVTGTGAKTYTVAATGSSTSPWTTSWAGSRAGTEAWFTPSGTGTAGSDGRAIRLPAPVNGWVTNLIASLSSGANAIGANTNVGITLFTNGVATALHGNFIADGTAVVFDSSTTATYVSKNSLMSIRATNDSAGFTIQINGSLQILPAASP